MRIISHFAPLFFLAGLTVGMSAFPADAQSAPGQTCEAASIFDDDGRLLMDQPMRIAAPAGGREYLLDRPASCPAGGAPCPWRRRAFLVGEDAVLAGAERAGFRCVHFVGRGGQHSSGFVPAASLRAATELVDAALSADALLGTWRSKAGVGASNVVAFARGPNGTLVAEGNASWASGRPGDVRTGEFEGAVKLQSDGFAVRSEECEVLGLRRGFYLALRDNAQCGGMNVSFIGLYARDKR